MSTNSQALKKARWTLRASMASIVLLIAWAAWSSIDQVTHTQGQVIAVSRTQSLQAPDGGVVTQIHVKEGETVKRGQLLVMLDQGRAQAAVDDSRAKVAALKITLARLNSEIYGHPLEFEPELLSYTEYIRNQKNLYAKRKTLIEQEIASLNDMLGLASKELLMNKSLEKAGDVSSADILRLERSVADIRSQITNKRNKYFQEVQSEMTKAQEDLNTQLEQLHDRTQLLEHTELTAPTDGIVKNIKVTTIGGVVRAGEVIMEILPIGNLIVEVKIPTSDVAFVKIGQEASIKLDAYDYSVYGALKGHIDYISPDTLLDETKQGAIPYYRGQIVIDESQFKGKQAKAIEVKPGMTASVDIKARERTVLSYLTKPITKTFQESLGER